MCVCDNIFSLLFSLYSKIILTELVYLPVFIIKGHNLNNIHYAEDTVLMADSQGKLKELLNMVVKESKKKKMTIKCKNIECIAFVSKKDSLRCELHFWDIKI